MKAVVAAFNQEKALVGAFSVITNLQLFEALLRDPDIRLRTSDPAFLGPVTAWFTELFSVLRPLLFKNGGPIIMIQVENRKI